jgi:RNA polymerase sigma factor (sigma-70 family)
MSFELLVKRIAPTLKKITRKLNGHYSFFNDEDLYQEALVRLWADYRKGNLEDKTDSYILQGCYFHLRNYLRKTRDNATLLSLSSPLGEGGMNPEDYLCLQDVSALNNMERHLHFDFAGKASLTDREKMILGYFIEGMSMREIGSRLGISHVMVLKIRNKIKAKYEHTQRAVNN